MELRRGKFFYPDCPVCRSRQHLGEFEKVLEHDDAGISVYRYRVPEGAYKWRKDVPREIFILETSKNVVKLNLDLFAQEYQKCRTHCPRCKEMMRRAEALFKEIPSIHKRGVSGHCGHASLGDYVCCPPCKDIVEKFLRHITGAREDREGTRLQTYLDRSPTQVEARFEDAVKSAVALQTKEAPKRKQSTETEDKENISSEMEAMNILKEAAKSSSRSNITKDLESIAMQQNELESNSKIKITRDLEIITKLQKELGSSNKSKIARDLETITKVQKELGPSSKSTRDLETLKTKLQNELGSSRKTKITRELETLKTKLQKELVTSNKSRVTRHLVTKTKLQEEKGKTRVTRDLELKPKLQEQKGKSKVTRYLETKTKLKETKGKSKVSSDGETSKSKSTGSGDDETSITKLSPKKKKDSAERDKVDKTKKGTGKKSKGTTKSLQERTYDKSLNTMRKLIAKQLKDKLQLERDQRDLAKQKEGMEHQAAEAEKKLKEAARKAKEADVARRLRFQRLLEKQGISSASSLDHFQSAIDVCMDAPEGVYHIIRGEEIHRVVTNQIREREMPAAAPEPEPPAPLVSPTRPPSTPTDIRTERTQSFLHHHGVLRYSLSNRLYIEKGWTLLPKEMVLRKMTVYQMRPAHPELDWFQLHRHMGQLHYDSGDQLATFEDDGSARIYYRNGDVALSYYAAEDTAAGQRLVLYSPRDRGNITVLAMFDYAGNGIVLDQAGQVRLKYNQTEGVVLDPKLGPRSHWKWHSLNDAPEMSTMMIENLTPFKDPYIIHLGETDGDSRSEIIPDETEDYMKSIELENAFKIKRAFKKLKFTPYEIKMKAVKINEYFTLRIFSQMGVYLMYCDGRTRLKFNMGLVLDPTKIIDHDMAEIGDFTNTLESVPACSASVEQLHKIVRNTRTKERLRIARERRVNRPDPWEGVHMIDRSTSFSPPKVPPIRLQRRSSVCGNLS